MKYDDICSVVAQRAGIDRSRADRAVKAVLQALSEQTDPAVSEVEALWAQLPAEFAKIPGPEERGTRRSPDEFLTEVAVLADIPPAQARRPVLAVFAALAAATAAFTSVVRTLGDEYTALLPPPEEMRDPAVFLATVAHRAEVATSDAEAATRATLDALAARITAGQAADLAAYLPPTLRPRLDTASAQAQAFDYAEFLARIAGQRQPAEVYAAAVLATVREAAPEPEIQNTLAQLPNDLARLFT